MAGQDYIYLAFKSKNLKELADTSEMVAARMDWGAYASPRVVFGVSPNRIFRWTPEIARGDACAPQAICAPTLPIP